QTHRGAAMTLELPQSLSDSLRRLSRTEGATLYMMLMAAFKVLLSRYAGQDDIVVGTPIAGRNRREIEGLIGFFVNTLVLRTKLSTEMTFRELLRKVRESALGAFAHQDLPFERLADELQPARSLSRSPIFQVAFALQNSPAAPLQLPGLEISLLGTETQTSKFDLSLMLTDTRRAIRGSLEYNTDLFDAST